MILAVDIGNTNIVAGGIYDNGKICFTARMSTDRTFTEDQYGILFKNVLELYGIDVKSINGCIISSVVPPVLNPVRAGIKKLAGIDAMIVSPGIKTGLNILMDNPAQVGSDLIVNAVAALDKFKPPIIIFDMGTATTISVVDKGGNYIGGCIMAGVKASLDAISQKAAQLPEISLISPKAAIGKNTVECMRSGAFYGTASMIDGMIEKIEAEICQKAVSVATGGIAKVIVPFCEKDIVFDEHLLLKGLYIIYRKNM